MLTKAAFGLALVVASVSGSFAATHAHYRTVDQTGNASAFVPSEPTIFGWPVHTKDEPAPNARARGRH